jgi:hypothetical protein
MVAMFWLVGWLLHIISEVSLDQPGAMPPPPMADPELDESEEDQGGGGPPSYWETQTQKNESARHEFDRLISQVRSEDELFALAQKLLPDEVRVDGYSLPSHGLNAIGFDSMRSIQGKG